MASTLASRLLACVPESLQPRLRARPELERELEDGIAQARARWPGVEIDDRAFWAEVAQRVEDTGEPPAPEALEEVYIAVACAAGAPAALAAFEGAYLANLGGVLGRFRLSPATLDEIRQALRTRLLVGTPPRVVRYAGRGGLERLVAVAAIRLAIDDRRTRRGGTVDAAAIEPAVAGRDPELAYMHRAYSSAFKHAFERAIDELSPRDRTLLRLHIVDDLAIDDIAAIYDLHRATVARRIDAARQTVARSARRHLRGAGIDREQLAEAFSLVKSQLDLSVTRVLAARGPDDGDAR
jgi:RNA polymerase sigma-70 factor (ECF subfamily)